MAKYFPHEYAEEDPDTKQVMSMISGPQFQNDPDTIRMKSLYGFYDGLRALHNSFVSQSVSHAGLMVAHTLKANSEHMNVADLAFANGDHDMVHHILNKVHQQLKASLLNPVTASDADFQNSYTGHHLKELVNETFPKFIEQYKGTLEH
jgi:hypothetical protein